MACEHVIMHITALENLRDDMTNLLAYAQDAQRRF
jgi:hypothetical protein